MSSKKNLRDKEDPKCFSKMYKMNLLESIQNDSSYVVNNSFDYLYRLPINFGKP